VLDFYFLLVGLAAAPSIYLDVFFIFCSYFMIFMEPSVSLDHENRPELGAALILFDI
jgi:hypothetical protein